MSYHTIVAVGYLGRDPELSYTPSGSAVCNFSMATSRKYTTGEGTQVDETTWFRITVWGKQGENVSEFLKKGSLVLVEGRLRPDDRGNPRTFTRQDGTPGASFEITAQTVRFLGGRSDRMDTGDADIPRGEEDAGDIPF